MSEPGGFLALEMEEVESLVGTGNRQKLGTVKRLNGHGNNNNLSAAAATSTLASCASSRNFLPKCVVLACLVLLALLIISAKDEQNGGSVTVGGDVEDKSPIPAPTMEPTSAPPPTDPPVDEDAKKKAEEEEAKKKAEEEAAAKKKAEEEEAAKKKAEEEEAAKMKAENDALSKDVPAPPPTLQPTVPTEESFYYSNRATIPPLINHPFPDDDTKEKLAEKYGKWKFWDGEEEDRPTEDYLSKYPNLDIPGDEFPDDAWQGDAVFVNHILNDGDLLVSRAMEAIFTEYGHGKPLEPEQMADRMKMFHWIREDLSTATEPPEKYRKNGDKGNGGWTTKRSFDGLVRRLLHAMMTQDTFTVVMGGHSAAVGQGNHFRQSYMMQFHKVMYPVFARMGVKLITRNMAQGGLNTIQAGMGLGSIYGDEIDLLIWDSGEREDSGDATADDDWMTEKDHPEFTDMFFRQALLSGKRVPVIWGGPFELLKMLHEEADVDVGVFGTAMDGIPEVESAEQAKTLPWAARYMKCKDNVKDLCSQEPRFCAKCWIDRSDNIKPEAKQLEHPKGQVKWHPGWRVHQLTGRNIAFGVLEALLAAINIWNEGVMGGPPLEDSLWHVTDYYENIRTKVKNLDKKVGKCNVNEKFVPARMCTTPMKAYTQYTPRANYDETSITSILKPAPDGYVPKNEKTLLYNGPDAHNTCFDIPEDSVDVFNVVTGRRHLKEENLPLTRTVNVPELRHQVPSAADISIQRNSTSYRHLADAIVPGKGWEVWGEPPGVCDGTYNAVCAIETHNECAMYGHHDARGAIVGNEYSGWLVLTLRDVKEGIIVIKIHTWHTPEESTKTEGWKSVDNAKRQRRRLRESGTDSSTSNATLVLNRTDDISESRNLGVRNTDTPELPDGFAFEYAIDGKITSLDKKNFLDKKKKMDRVVEVLTLIDDPNFTKNAKDVEVAIRLKGSGRDIVFGLSHVYYA